MRKRQAPYRHADNTGCWTRNCSLGHRSSAQVAATGDVNAFLAAKAAEKQAKPDAKALLGMFGTPASASPKFSQKPSQPLVPKVDEWREQFGSRPKATDYYMEHRAPDGSLEDDDYAAASHDLTKIFPADVMEHPEWYCGEPDKAMFAQLKKMQGNPEAMVTIYRSAPHSVNKINNGDWVTLNKQYALQHGQQSNPEDDWPVIEARVPAKFLWTEGNDLNEFGLGFPE